MFSGGIEVELGWKWVNHLWLIFELTMPVQIYFFIFHR